MPFVNLRVSQKRSFLTLVMPRPRKVRKLRYRSYFEKDVDEFEVPESTLRYVRKKVRVHVQVVISSCL